MKHLLFLFAMTSSSALAELKIGMSEGDITPTTSQILGGYGTYFLKSSLRMSEGVHDPLLTGAMALQNEQGQVVVLATADLVGMSPSLKNRIALKTRPCGNPQIFLSATHTHHSPDVVGLWGPLPSTGRNDAYMNFLETKIASTICSAIAKMESAKILFASSFLKPDSPLSDSDPQLSFLKIENKKGQLLGTVAQWGAHPAILTQKNTMLSADFPGAYRSLMKQKTPGIHLYFSGTLGGTYKEKDLSPIADIFQNGRRSPAEDPQNYGLVSRQGERLFEAIQNLNPLQVEGSNLSSMTLKIKSQNKNRLFSTGFALRVLEKRPEMKSPSDSDSINTEVSLIQIGNLAIATLPGEAFPAVTNKIRNYLAQLNFVQTMIFGLTNDWLGYIIDPSDYDLEELKYYRTLSIGPQFAGAIYSKFESQNLNDF